MPQACDELRKKFPGYDSEALEVIAQNFDVRGAGVIFKKNRHYEPTMREWDAVNYLIQEWDFAYEA
jgi:hypothetical protein